MGHTYPDGGQPLMVQFITAWGKRRERCCYLKMLLNCLHVDWKGQMSSVSHSEARGSDSGSFLLVPTVKTSHLSLCDTIGAARNPD